MLDLLKIDKLMYTDYQAAFFKTFNNVKLKQNISSIFKNRETYYTLQENFQKNHRKKIK